MTVDSRTARVDTLLGYAHHLWLALARTGDVHVAAHATGVDRTNLPTTIAVPRTVAEFELLHAPAVDLSGPGRRLPRNFGVRQLAPAILPNGLGHSAHPQARRQAAHHAVARDLELDGTEN
ncbi:MAG: hypothetical protein ACRDT0_19390 [Pseudonocardiaceae bacterium]